MPKEPTMSCCHADFSALAGSDRGFTIGMPTFTFGRGVLAEAGDNARELGMKRAALFTDPRLASSEYVAIVKASLAPPASTSPSTAKSPSSPPISRSSRRRGLPPRANSTAMSPSAADP
jgi:hypothetical protein